MRDDLRFAWRQLRKSPGFSLAAILTLGLAIGANAAVFSLVDAVLLKPLPYPHPDRLALLSRVYSRDGARLNEDTSHTGTVWEFVRDQATTVDAAVVTGLSAQVSLVAGNQALTVAPQRVSAGFFRVLGVTPALGREFTRDEDRNGAAPVAVLSDRLWRTVLHSDPNVIGQTILLKGEPHVIVGVMAPGFLPLGISVPGNASVEADLWTPVRPSRNGEGGGENYGIVLRLRDGITLAQAVADVAAAGDQGLTRRTLDNGLTLTHGVVSMQESLAADVRRPLLLLWASVGVVLLVACVNLAGLLLARGGRRAREFATRLAIGGSRGAIVRQLLVETTLLAVLGGVLGLAIGVLALDALKTLAADLLTTWGDVQLDGRVVLATLALTTLTAAIFGLAPALQATRLNVQAALTQGGTRAIAGSARGWSRRALVLVEVALGVVLLVGAGLLVRTFVYLQTQSPGFDATNVIAASASLEDARYVSRERVQQLFTDSLARIRALPGVESAAVSLGLPYERILNMGAQVRSSGSQAAEFKFSTLTYVTPGYFATLRLPVLRGRALADGDSAGAASVIVVNESFANRYFSDRDPVGEHIRVANVDREVVGVVGNVQQRGGFAGFGPIDALPGTYVTFEQFPAGALRVYHGWFSPAWIVRASAPGAVTEQALRRAMADVDPQLPLSSVRGVDAVRSTALARQRLLMSLVGALGVVALLLTAVGIHGLISSGVNERTRELGIRLALGSTVSAAVRTAALPGIYLAIVGLAIGSVAAYGASGLIRNLLWGVRENDPITFAAVAGTLLVVAVLASVLPALRVRRLDPVMLLRAE
jgi:putative ABC transport system permease protein